MDTQHSLKMDQNRREMDEKVYGRFSGHKFANPAIQAFYDSLQ